MEHTVTHRVRRFLVSIIDMLFVLSWVHNQHYKVCINHQILKSFLLGIEHIVLQLQNLFQLDMLRTHLQDQYYPYRRGMECKDLLDQRSLLVYMNDMFLRDLNILPHYILHIRMDHLCHHSRVDIVDMMMHLDLMRLIQVDKFDIQYHQQRIDRWHTDYMMSSQHWLHDQVGMGHMNMNRMMMRYNQLGMIGSFHRNQRMNQHYIQHNQFCSHLLQNHNNMECI